MLSPKQVLDRVIESVNTNREESYVELAGDDLDLRAPGGVSLRGKDGFRQWYRTWKETCPDCTLQCHNAIGDGTQVMWEGTFAGTHTGVLHLPSGDVPPTGRQVSVDYAGVMHVADGKIAYLRDYFDGMDLMAQFGVAGAKVAAGSLGG